MTSVQLTSSHFHRAHTFQRNDHRLSRLPLYQHSSAEYFDVDAPRVEGRQNKQSGANILYLGIKSLLEAIAA